MDHPIYDDPYNITVRRLALDTIYWSYNEEIRFRSDDILRRYVIKYLEDGGSERSLARTLALKFNGVINNYGIYRHLGVDMSLPLSEHRALSPTISIDTLGPDEELYMDLSIKTHRALMLPLTGRIGTTMYFFDMSNWRLPLEYWYKALPRG